MKILKINKVYGMNLKGQIIVQAHGVNGDHAYLLNPSY